MESPVLPADFKSVIPDPTGSKCESFARALLRLPVLLYKLVAYMLDSSGNLNVDFKRGVLASGTYEFAAAELPLDGSRLICDGSTVSRTTYAALFAVIGEVYGVGDGSTTFALPDFRDRFPIGQSATKTGGSTGGEATHLITQAELPDYALATKATQTTGDPVLNVAYGTGAGASPVEASAQQIGPTGVPPFATEVWLDGGETPMPLLPLYLSVWVYIRT